MIIDRFVEKYINPYSNVGFKKLFGEEANYVLKNLNRINRIPEKLRGKICKKQFRTDEIAHFSREQVRSYEDSLKYYRDLNNTLYTPRDEGSLEGKVEGKNEVASELLKMGLSMELIIQTTGLTQN